MRESELSLRHVETRLFESERRLLEPETSLLKPETRLFEAETRLLEVEARLLEAETRFLEVETRFLKSRCVFAGPRRALALTNGCVTPRQTAHLWGLFGIFHNNGSEQFRTDVENITMLTQAIEATRYELAFKFGEPYEDQSLSLRAQEGGTW